MTDYGQVGSAYGMLPIFSGTIALAIIGVGVWIWRHSERGMGPATPLTAAGTLWSLGLSLAAFTVAKVADTLALQQLLASRAAQAPIESTTPWLVNTVALGVAGFAFAAYWSLLAVWVYLDGRRNWGDRAFAFGMLTLLTNAVGWAVYLAVRPRLGICPGCGADTPRRVSFCVRCGHALRPACPDCRRTVETDWVYCAACGGHLVE
jgi:hypothetical protein